jgi:hypothetical protein
MRGYSTKWDWRHGRPDHGWWVELLKDGERVAYNNKPRRVEERAAPDRNRDGRQARR